MTWHDPMLHLLLLLLINLPFNLSQDESARLILPYPQFFLQPQKQSVKREMTTSVDCGAYGGIGTLTYTFYKGTTPQSNMMTMLETLTPDRETGVAAYTIARISSTDAGYYQCVGSDEVGVRVYSDVVYLEVVDNYLTRVEPVTISRLLLSTSRVHVLNCTMPPSNPAATPRWFRDSVPVGTDDPNMFVSLGSGTIESQSINLGDLVLFSLAYSHSGNYKCSAYNPKLNSSNNQIDIAYYDVTVGASGDVPKFVSREAVVSDTRINVGEEGFIFCGGVGNPAPDTEFLTISPALEGFPDSDKASRLVRVAGSLTNTPNMYYATCRVGSNYFSAKLEVVEPPINSVDSVRFVDEDTRPIVYYTETDRPPRVLSCGTSDAGVAKQWFKNGLVWNRGPYHETDLSSGFDLIANDVRPEDSGVYQCKAFSTTLAIYRTQVLCVVKKLTIETVSPTLSEIEKRSKKLTCTIRGSPTPTMIWTLAGEELLDSEKTVITHNALSYPYTTTLELTDITLADSGTYECGALNTIPPYQGKPQSEDSVAAAIYFKVNAPVLVTSPTSTILAFAGKSLTLECTTYGEPKPSVPQWKHQDTAVGPIDGELDITYTEYDQGYVSKLTISSISLANQGNYTCSSWNYVTDNTTSTVRISIPVISPINVTAPYHVEVEKGVIETVTCVATGHPPANDISWSFNNQTVTEGVGTTVSEQTVTSVLTLEPLTPAAAGEFRCNSTNAYKDNVYTDTSIIEAFFVSTVQVRAEVQNIVGVHGRPLKLICIASGYPIPDEIRWASRSYLVQDSRNFEISSSLNHSENTLISEMLISDVRYSHERSYNCSASNYFKGRKRYASDSINVVVEFPVQMRTRSKYAYNTLGKPVDVTCEIEGKPLPEQINWFFSGTPGQDVTRSPYYLTTLVSSDNTANATLRINELSQGLIGDYNCSASNVVDGVTYYSSMVVNVEQVRRVIVAVKTGVKSVAKGKEANLTCSGEGVPPPRPGDIEWFFKGDKLPNYSLKYLMEVKEERLYKMVSVLRISDSQLADAGLYTCRFSNIDKTNSSYRDEKSIRLVVQVPVEVNFTDSSLLELYEGKQATVTCNIFGKPAPRSITWVRSKTGMEIASDYIFDVTTTNTSGGERLTSVLTLKSMSLDLEGTYECRGENMLSSGRVITTPAYKRILRVQDVDVIPKSVSVPAVVDLIARITCSAEGVPTPTPLQWSYRSGVQSRPIFESDQYLISQEKFFDDTRAFYTKIESTLTIKMVRWLDRGTYICSSSNTINGEIKFGDASTVLNVGYPVSLNRASAETLQTLLGSQVGTLSLPLYGFPPPDVTWLKDGAPLAPDSFSTQYVAVEEYSGVAQLTLHHVTVSHSGTYTVTANNTVHTNSTLVTAHITVEVFFTPAISLEATREVLEMTTDKIPCVVTSLPVASDVTWSFNGTDVEELSPSKYSMEELVHDVRGDLPTSMRTLVLKQARLSDGGVYTCRAAVLITDRLHYARKRISLSVVSAVVVSPTEVTVEGELDKPANLTCIAYGYPRPSEVLWYFNNTLLISNNDIVIQDYSDSFKQVRSTLLLRKLTPDYLGDYECRSTNIVMGLLKTDKAEVSIVRENLAGVGKTVTSKEMLIIGVLAAIILVVILGVVLLLVCRHRRKGREREEYERMKMESTPANGADSTLRADAACTNSLLQIDPTDKTVEYAELDPRVYKSDYKANKFQPLPRKKRSSIHYAQIEGEHRLI